LGFGFFMIRSTVAHVDLAALQANLRAIQSFLAAEASADVGRAFTARPADHEGPPHAERPDQEGPPHAPRVIAVVKANAYGHGAARVALALEAAGADLLACADIEEGIALRRAGVRTPILVFGALSVSDLDGLFEFSLTPTMSTPSAARALQAAAARHKTTLRYHLKVDTGMNRLGFRHDNLRWTLPELLASTNLQLEAVFTHFATADVPGDPLFDTQRVQFEQALAVIEGLLAPLPALPASPAPTGLSPSPSRRRRFLVHACNSAALLRDSRLWYDLVRPGLLLYGIVPPPLAATIPLQPVMSLTSRVVAVKGLRPGEGVGYGWRYRADEPRTVAVIPAGYADGLDLRLSGRGSVLIRGRRVPIIGAVSMDMITVDVTGAGDVAPGDEVVIIGRQGDESWQQIDVREVAAAIGSIPWEVVCRVGMRIERDYGAT
jgi:alanine racemase